MIVVDTNMIGYHFLTSDHSAYDCEFIALAKDLD